MLVWQATVRCAYIASAIPAATTALLGHYIRRWLSSRGETVPWCEAASATIGA